MDAQALRATSPHWAYVDEVSQYLKELFDAVRSGAKARDAAQRLFETGKDRTSWSPQLNEDLVRAAKVLASAWKFRGMLTCIR